MTRKDYIIAEALRFEYESVQSTNNQSKVTAVWNVARTIALALSNDNSRFDTDHFLAVVRGEKSLTSRPEETAANVVIRNPRMLADTLKNTEELNEVISHPAHKAVQS